jgi:hypothetical protein
MRTRAAIAVVLVCVACITAGFALHPAFSQQEGGPPMPPGGPGMGGGPMGGPPGPPPAPPVQMLAADGALYVACDGKVTAYEAKTLKKLAEATYSERKNPPGPPPGMGN